MKKGFTLVELLAVIVILAIILAITIPGISNVIESSRRGAAESDAKMLLKAIEYKMLVDNAFDPSTITEGNIKEILGIDASNYLRLTVKKMNGKVYITMVGQDKWEGITISGTKGNTKLEETVTVEGANAPMLAEGMIPVKWYENGTEKYWVTTTKNDPEWYEYGTTEATRRWANTVTVNASGTGPGVDNITRHDRSWYQSQPSGTPISISDINTMWVWIPRYVYKISSGWHREGLTAGQAGTIDIQFSKGVDDSWNGPIDLRETAYASKATGTNNNGNKYTNHPAFTFGDRELTGIWVAKFEASSNNPGAANGGGNVTNLKVKLVPNVVTWRSINVSNIFTVTRSMETDDFYGWSNNGNGIDTHMMKNTEWGAVAYLSKSIYGINSEILLNNSRTYESGCAGESVSDVPFTGCEFEYNTSNGKQASSTGNIYGVYDMNGGTNERTAAYINNDNPSLTNNGLALINADDKYKNVYAVSPTDTEPTNYLLTISFKGDAIYETSNAGTGAFGWYSDYSFMTREEYTFFGRGGYYTYGSNSGSFYFGRGDGAAMDYGGFRPVLLVGLGL